MGFSDEEAEAQRSEHACPGPPSVRIRIRHLASQWEGPLLTLPMAALLSGSADLASGLPLSAEFGSPPAELESTGRTGTHGLCPAAERFLGGAQAGGRSGGEVRDPKPWARRTRLGLPGQTPPGGGSRERARGLAGTQHVLSGRGGWASVCWAATRCWAKIRVKSA